PLEWRQAIYEEKLAQACQSIVADTHIQTLCPFFDADLDEESIRPLYTPREVRGPSDERRQ
uniref:DNA polymerase III subunit gamma/tau C-terminal domain-containing protein n=1 Tax=Serratia bockelmannii TaxID=2703793 RepID=UPI003CE9C467